MPVSFAEVARIWRDWDLQPHRVETFKFSTDPQLEAKIRDVVGLYLDPPQQAVVVCVDEKSQIQALDRTAPLLPMRFDQAERRTHDYKRHGTTTLFAALEVATGRITADACHPRHRNGEFLAFLKQVAKAHPRVQLHVVCDNYATHNHPNVKKWLARNPPHHHALHPDRCVLDEHGGDLLRDHHPTGHPPRHLHQRAGPHRAPSGPSSTPTTSAASPSLGPRPPTRSSPKPTVKRPQTRDTSDEVASQRGCRWRRAR
jgi:DDE superfamily endonuclease